jgi:hypothetical protein
VVALLAVAAVILAIFVTSVLQPADKGSPGRSPTGPATSTAPVQLEGFTLQEAPPAGADPVVDQPAAARTAIDALTNINGSVKGLVLMEAHLARDLTEIRDAGGSLSYSSTEATDCWVLVYAGPPQNGFRIVKALVVVDALTGEVGSAQLLQSN